MKLQQIKKLYRNNKYKKVINLIAFFVISLFIELFIFNYPGIRTLTCKNKNVTMDYYVLDTSNSNGNVFDFILGKDVPKIIYKENITKGNNILAIKDINFPVTSIDIYYKEADDYGTDIYSPYFIAYGNKYMYYELESKTLNNANEAIFKLDTKKVCYGIKIEINTSTDIKEIDKIVLNKPHFNINFIRIFVIFASLLFIYSITTNKIAKYNLEKNKVISYIILSLFTIFLLYNTITIFYNMNKLEMSNIFISKEEIKPNDTINLQVNSIINNDEGNYEIDTSSESETYDIAKYSNKNYNFTNNILVYILLLPIAKLFGYYINIYYINLFLLIILEISILAIYILIIKRYIKNISTLNFILGYIVLILGSNALFARRIIGPDFAFLTNIILEIFYFILIILHMNTKNKVMSNILLLLLSTCSGLITFNTPKGFLFIAILIYYITKKIINLDIKEKLVYSLVTALPIIICITSIFVLNNNRFNLIFEYGNYFNVKSLDSTFTSTSPLSYYIKGIIETIAIEPNLDFFRFPFSNMDVLKNNTFDNEFKYDNNILGLISFPIIWFLIIKSFLKPYDKEAYKKINIIIIFSFVILFINEKLYGLSEIYTLETKLILMIAALLFIFKYIQYQEDKNKISTINKFFIVLAILNILIIFPISISTDKMYLHQVNNPYVNTLKNAIMFWI